MICSEGLVLCLLLQLFEFHCARLISVFTFYPELLLQAAHTAV